MEILNALGSALPLMIICLSLSIIIHSNKVTKNMLIGYTVISVISFILLLRT